MTIENTNKAHDDPLSKRADRSREPSKDQAHSRMVDEFLTARAAPAGSEGTRDSGTQSGSGIKSGEALAFAGHGDKGKTNAGHEKSSLRELFDQERAAIGKSSNPVGEVYNKLHGLLSNINGAEVKFENGTWTVKSDLVQGFWSQPFNIAERHGPVVVAGGPTYTDDPSLLFQATPEGFKVSAINGITPYINADTVRRGPVRFFMRRHDLLGWHPATPDQMSGYKGNDGQAKFNVSGSAAGMHQEKTLGPENVNLPDYQLLHDVMTDPQLVQQGLDFVLDAQKYFREAQFKKRDNGAVADQFEPGNHENKDGSSYYVNTAGRITSFTCAKSERFPDGFTYKNIQYDESGAAKSFQQEPTGDIFTRSEAIDGQGYATWACWDSTGRPKIYAAAGADKFNGKFTFDDSGAYIGIKGGQTLRMYSRSGDGTLTTSQPLVSEGNILDGYETTVYLPDKSQVSMRFKYQDGKLAADGPAEVKSPDGQSTSAVDLHPKDFNDKIVAMVNALLDLTKKGSSKKDIEENGSSADAMKAALQAGELARRQQSALREFMWASSLKYDLNMSLAQQDIDLRESIAVLAGVDVSKVRLGPSLSLTLSMSPDCICLSNIKGIEIHGSGQGDRFKTNDQMILPEQISLEKDENGQPVVNLACQMQVKDNGQLIEEQFNSVQLLGMNIPLGDAATLPVDLPFKIPGVDLQSISVDPNDLGLSSDEEGQLKLNLAGLRVHGGFNDMPIPGIPGARVDIDNLAFGIPSLARADGKLKVDVSLGPSGDGHVPVRIQLPLSYILGQIKQSLEKP